MSFKGISMLSALRYFLSSFELPGESQKVERILEFFSLRFLEENPDKLDPDSAYMLAFLIIMLQTNVYNPKVIEKMSLTDFQSIGKQIKVGDKPIDPEILSGFYHDIKETPVAIHSKEKRKLEIQNIIQASNKLRKTLLQQEFEKM